MGLYLYLFYLFLFAQEIPKLPDVIPPGSGWVGTGLLATVLSWLLFKHLPAKDRQIEKLIEDKDKLIVEMVGKFDISLQETRQEYKDSLGIIVAHCERETSRLADTIVREFAELRGERRL